MQPMQPPHGSQRPLAIMRALGTAVNALCDHLQMCTTAVGTVTSSGGSALLAFSLTSLPSIPCGCSFTLSDLPPTLST